MFDKNWLKRRIDDEWKHRKGKCQVKAFGTQGLIEGLKGAKQVVIRPPCTKDGSWFVGITDSLASLCFTNEATGNSLYQALERLSKSTDCCCNCRCCGC